jgi:hypothetical protein
MLRGFRSLAIVVFGLIVANTARADWTAPKDNLLTEKQVTSYIEIQTQWLADMTAAGKAAQGASGLTAMAVVQQVTEKYKKSIADHGMTEPEFNWVKERTVEAWGGIIRAQMVEKMKGDIEKQLKDNEQKIADDQQKLAAYQKAQKEGRRVMPADARKAAIDAAMEDQKNALDEARQHADELKAAQAALAQAQANQKAAEAALKTPPKFDSDDDRKAFIDDKQNAIQAAKDAAKDAQGNIDEATKAEAASRAKAALAASVIKDPDLPVTDDAKAEAKQQNEDSIKQLTDEIKALEDGDKLLQDAIAQQTKAFADDKTNPPAQNIALLKAHQKEFEGSLGMKK